MTRLPWAFPAPQNRMTMTLTLRFGGEKKKEKNSVSLKTHPHGSSSSCVPGLGEELTPARARSPPARVFLPPATVTPGAVQPCGFVSRYFSTSLFFP